MTVATCYHDMYRMKYLSVELAGNADISEYLPSLSNNKIVSKSCELTLFCRLTTLRSWKLSTKRHDTQICLEYIQLESWRICWTCGSILLDRSNLNISIPHSCIDQVKPSKWVFGFELPWLNWM